MKLLYDFFPLLIFFVFYKATNIFVATGALIVATAVQLVLMWVKFKRVETMHVVTFILVLVFGGLTIWLHDAMFLKWKVSIVNWLFGAAFLLTQFIGKRTLVEMPSSNNKTNKSDVNTVIFASSFLLFFFVIEML